MTSIAPRALLPLALAITAAALPAAAGAAGPGAPHPGSAGVGDRLFPSLGNGGYDVRHYGLDLRYDTEGAGQVIDGTARISARATQSLSRFDLDFAGGPVQDVAVNGVLAGWTREGEELVVTPARPLRDGSRFVVEVRHFMATATVPSLDDPGSTALFLTPDGSAMAPQPANAHRVYPSNDHPSDKATFSFVLDVPAGTTAVANGVLARRRTRHGRTQWRYVVRQPMQTALTQIAVGDYDVTPQPDVGPVELRDVTPPRLTAALLPRLGHAREHLEWLQERLGPYPADVYGALVVDVPVGLALETQTLTVFDSGAILDPPAALFEPHMVHELAHAWFGGSVSPAQWSDVWFDEGHAYLYQILYAADRGHLMGQTGFSTLDEFWAAVHDKSDELRAAFGPVARPVAGDFDHLFSGNAYLGGALVLEALRRHVGDDAFATIEREWLRRYAGRSASTADFIALASDVTGADQRPFLTPWLYGDVTPPLPEAGPTP